MSTVRHWWLGDVQTLTATDDVNEPPQVGAFGTYESLPVKDRGLLPEYGLATAFDGVAQRVTTLTGLVGTGGNFSLVALVRPAAGGLGAAQCLYQTGSTGSGYLGLNALDNVVFGVNGGTVVTSAEVLVAGGEYLVVGTYDGTQGRVYVGELVQGSTAPMNGPISMTFTAAHDIGTIGSNENTEYFEGALQGVAELNEALVQADVDDLLATGIWTDVTPDVEGPLTIDHGIHESGPLGRLAATGTCTFALDNSHINSAGLEGYYSPDHANARTGFREGIPVRVSLPDASSPANAPIQFIGTLRRAKIDAGIYRDRRVHCVSTDWMEEAAKVKLKGIVTQQNVRADEVIGFILNAMRNRPHQIDLQTGSDTYIFALDNVEDNTSTVQNELRRVAFSEVGFIYVRGDGTLVHEPRSARLASTVDYALSELLDVDQERTTDQIKNLVKMTVHPRDVDLSLVVLYLTDALSSPADQAIAIDNGVDIELFFPFTDPNQRAERVGGINVVTPVATTDYLINTAADGSGGNLTGHGSIVLVWRVGGNGVYLTVTNSYGQRVYFTFLQIRGIGVYDYTPLTLIAQDEDSIDEHGEQAVEIDMPYQSDALVAQSQADFILLTLKDRRTYVKTITLKAIQSAVNTAAVRDADISSRLDFSEDISGVNGAFLVQAKQILWKEGDDVDATFHVTADVASTFGPFWILDVSQLDLNTTLAP